MTGFIGPGNRLSQRYGFVREPATTSTASCGCTNFGLTVSVGADTGVVPLVEGGASVGVGVAPASTGGGASISQSQPSFMQLRKLPCLVRFSTMNGALHFGHGSLIGSWGGGETQSGEGREAEKT